ncbi:alpha/beta-hydrolase [Aspergillus heteromorphus CBS 117.55]|uniref:Alpha/beta-hydrolase n=1 Tax=Aspergillus heteromorphus CBS 117.55 TaxID=1448321 RepID=A0A317VPM0_9EURO|nr:alpha/beta-hydrolase [Aspergillus heteromorphus CBS 117.55]PWY75007.1 alpha/beta-hydrolase [Aspergillus heteromorphus CBS 117.55]
MVQAAALGWLGWLGLAGVALGTYAPYYANLTWEAPRALSNWSNLTVENRTGTFVGMLNDTYPGVRQFSRVPFAKPPMSDLRWLPPQRLDNSSKKYDSTFYGPACPQYVPSTSSFWNEYEPENLLLSVGEKLDQGSTAWSSAEDCLSLAVWTPSYATKTSQLPVALFVTGGGGITGGIEIPSQLPSAWVSRSQEHIVVTINYRSNIFGNPKSRALNETSLTLLDVRAAVEWVSENIEAFGGNSDNIMLWGQSQVALLTHLYTLAWPEDPFAAKFGVISQGASATINLTTTPDVYQDFDIVAKGLGCNYGDDAEAELNCMRQVSWVQIEEYINRYNSTPSIAFTNYIPDERYIFSDEAQRYAERKVAPGPSIRSDTAREFPSANTTEINIEEGVRNFTNISPVPWLGAFHWTDLLMIFETYILDVGEISELEVDTSATMQDYFLAFLKNSSTVGETVGWPAFLGNSTDGGTILEFGNGTTVGNIPGDWLDAGCYNSSIPFRIWG